MRPKVVEKVKLSGGAKIHSIIYQVLSVIIVYCVFSASSPFVADIIKSIPVLGQGIDRVGVVDISFLPVVPIFHWKRDCKINK